MPPEQELLIRQCLDGSAAEAQSTFNQLMLAQINDRMQVARTDFAATLYHVQPAATE